MRKYIQACLITTCISFTVEIVAFMLLPEQVVPILTKEHVLETFGICLTASFFAMYPFMKIENIIYAFILSVISLLCVLLGLGSFVFALIPLEWEVIGTILGCCLLIYTLCFFAMNRKNKEDVEVINERLKKMHKGEK